MAVRLHLHEQRRCGWRGHACSKRRLSKGDEGRHLQRMPIPRGGGSADEPSVACVSLTLALPRYCSASAMRLALFAALLLASRTSAARPETRRRHSETALVTSSRTAGLHRARRRKRCRPRQRQSRRRPRRHGRRWRRRRTWLVPRRSPTRGRNATARRRGQRRRALRRRRPLACFWCCRSLYLSKVRAAED